MKRMIQSMIMLLIVMTLSGCATTGAAEEGDGISVGKDGTITGTLVGVLDQSYYNSEELKTMITDEIADVNKSQGEGSVELSDFNCDSAGNVKVKIKYADSEAYEAFNGCTFFSGASVVAHETYGLQGNFLSVSDGKLTTEEAMVSEDSKIVVLSENVNVSVPGKIVAITDNVEITGKKTATVNIQNAEEDGEEKEEELAYIVYK